MPKRRYCVFRLVNEAKREVLLVATTRSIFEAIGAIHRSRPPAIRDWDVSDIAKFESLEFNLSKKAAADFVEARRASGSRRGYRYIVDFKAR